MARNVLLVGRTELGVDAAKSGVDVPDLGLSTATTLAEAREALATGEIAHVVMGAGIELGRRIEIARAVFEASDTTTVHMKDVASGPHGFLPLVKAILDHLP